jgi:hypothetical protein
VLLALLLLAAAPALFVLPYLALMPVFARDVLGIGAAGLGLLTAAIGVGALAGAVTVARSGRPSKRCTMLVGWPGRHLAVFTISRDVVVSVLRWPGWEPAGLLRRPTRRAAPSARPLRPYLSIYVHIAQAVPLGSLAAAVGSRSAPRRC